MDRKKDGKGNSSVATRRVTTENTPCPVFCETRKDAPGVLTVTPQGRKQNGKMKRSLRQTRRDSGQVMVEFIIMLVLATLLATAVLFLFGSVADNGERMSERVCYNVP